MAVWRDTPVCPYCDKIINGIYEDQSNIPINQQTIGDRFIRWDWEGHECLVTKRNKKIEIILNLKNERDKGTS